MPVSALPVLPITLGTGASGRAYCGAMLTQPLKAMAQATATPATP